jgi:hypothetical protein
MVILFLTQKQKIDLRTTEVKEVDLYSEGRGLEDLGLRPIPPKSEGDPHLKKTKNKKQKTLA